MVVVIFFSFGCVAGLYGPRLFTDPEHLNGMGRSENFAKEFESGHEHLKGRLNLFKFFVIKIFVKIFNSWADFDTLKIFMNYYKAFFYLKFDF